MLEQLTRAVATIAAILLFSVGIAASAEPASLPTHATTVYKFIDIKGLKVFYREAGPAAAPTVLLLHGLDGLIWVVADPSAALHANSFHFERAGSIEDSGYEVHPESHK
jgi:hypothetical protein